MLYTFGGNNIPFGLTQSLGRLYGTIFLGGGGGQVYSLSLSGKKTVIFTPHHTTGRPAEFQGVTAPGGPLIVTSVEGGICTGTGYGTVFAVDKGNSVVRLLHSFCGNGDGEYPVGPVVSVNGTLYGTTQRGGAHGLGTIYSISPSGQDSVIYSFAAPINDTGPLTYVGGKLYGTYTSPDGDALYTVDAAGNLTVLHVFTSAEGQPMSGLVAGGATLYGVSLNALYSLDASGNFAVVHTFPSNPKSSAGLTGGLYANSTPVYLGGALYGTTQQGGASGVGAVYKYRP